MPDVELFTDARDTVAKRLRGMLLQGVAQSRLQNARNRVHRPTSRERHHHCQRPDRPGFGFERAGYGMVARTSPTTPRSTGARRPIVLTDEFDAPLEWVQIALHANESPPLEVFDLGTGTVRVTDVL